MPDIGHGGGHGPVITLPEQFNKLYGELRAQLLSRHFALGRYFRADHLCFTNYLGVVHQTGGTSDDTLNDIVHNCLWSNVLNGDGTNVYQPDNNAADLLAIPLGTGNVVTGNEGDQLFERWRVGDHSRTNPLMYSGQLMVCLAVEWKLGIPGSLDILSRLLSTTGSLFKFTNAPFNGYILRWDAVTTDHWTVVPGQSMVQGRLVVGKVDRCCDFFPITDPSAPDGYLYSTPLDDPRYTAYMESSDFNALSNTQQLSYYAARLISLYQNRYWEPSQDELTGYLAGLSFVSTVVSDETIKNLAASQAALVGAWMSANGYLLVRPNGGFVAQGAAGVGSSFEYPFGRIFSRLTGSSFAATGGFISALKNSGIWPAISTGWAAATIIGVGLAGIASSLFTVLGGSLLAKLLLALLTGGITIIAARAIVLLLDSEAFDVYAWPGNGKSGSQGVPSSNGQQTQFALAYLLSLLPTKLRFVTWMTGSGLGIGGYSQNFPPFLGLSAFGDTVATVRNAYLRWFSNRGGNTPAPSSIPPRPQAVLLKAITAADNTITVDYDASVFGSPPYSPPFFVSIGSETLLVTAFVPLSLKWAVVRGQLGTTPAAAPEFAAVTGMPFAETTLAVQMLNTDNTITVNSSTNFGSQTGFYVSIGSEVLQVNKLSGPGNTTWGVNRTQDNTTAATKVPAGTPVTGMPSDDGQADFSNSMDPFATAVAVLLGTGVSEQTKLVALLSDLLAEFASSSRQNQLALFDDNAFYPDASPAPYFKFNGSNAKTTQLVAEPVRPALNYLSALALAWFFSSLPTTDKSKLPQNFPVPPTVGTSLPPATIPSGVINNSFGAPVTAQVIPLNALPPLPPPSITLPPEIDLFAADAPSKPAKPPAPPTQITWILSTKKSHYGGLGGKGTDTLNAGQTLSTPRCKILGVKLFLIDKHGVPLGGVPTSVALGRASQIARVDPWPSPRARTLGIFQTGARILSIGPLSDPTDMTVKVQWWYAVGTACRYQIAYLVEGQNCSL